MLSGEMIGRRATAPDATATAALPGLWTTSGAKAATLCRTVLLEALNKRRIQLAAQAQPHECIAQGQARPATHDMRNTHQSQAPILLFDLPVDQSLRHLPLARPQPHAGPIQCPKWAVKA